MKRRTTRTLAIGIAVLAAVLVGFVPRAAAAPIAGTATGAWYIPAASVQTTTIGSYGGNTYQYQTATIILTGAISGTTIDTDINIINNSTGAFSGPGTMDCANCTLAGQTGGFTAVWYVTASGAKIPLTFTLGIGGLHGLTGGGIFFSGPGSTSNGSAYGTYSLNYQLG
jgi:hypothetical protein